MRELKKEEGLSYPLKLKFLCYVFFFILGVINNLGYGLILTGSKGLAKNLDNESLIALYPFALIAFSSLTRIVNSKFCLNISYTKKIAFLSIYFFTGYISLYIILNITTNEEAKINKTAAFLFTLIPSFIMGTGSSFGEANLLGYLRLFPKDLVAGWSSGTGLAGVSGALITLSFKLKDVNNKFLFLYVSPVCLIYLLAFLSIKYIKKKIDEEYKINFFEEVEEIKIGNDGLKIPKENELKEENLRKETSDKENETPAAISSTATCQEKSNSDSGNKELSFTNFIVGFKKAKIYIINLALVYYLEYVILSGFSERISSKENLNKTKAFEKTTFEVFCLCYQLGVLLSRSSLVVVKRIPKVEIFTILQAINFAIWFLNALYLLVTNIWVFFIHLFFVGLLGGAAYVGCFYFLLNSTEIEENLKELCINIGTVFNDIGILCSSLTVLFLDNTIMKK